MVFPNQIRYKKEVNPMGETVTANDILRERCFNQSKEIDELIKKIIRLEEEKRELEKLAMINPVSLIYNLNYVKDQIERIKKIKSRELLKWEGETKSPAEFIFMIFIDVDHLKGINDTRGHAAGNAALRKLGTVLESIVRRGDIATHLHGDEFAIMSMSTNRFDGKRLEQRVYDATRSIEVEEHGFSFSVSIGLQTTILSPKFSLERLEKKADAKMYRAKRNR
jgi:diguanylate cyclase (GGDEF)-like protein